MEDFKAKIREQLKIIEQMIDNNEKKEEIEKKRKELDEFLKIYLQNLK